VTSKLAYIKDNLMGIPVKNTVRPELSSLYDAGTIAGYCPGEEGFEFVIVGLNDDSGWNVVSGKDILIKNFPSYRYVYINTFKDFVND
jgi:hypothetical protein